MLQWLQNNAINLLILAVLAVAVGLAVRRMVRDRKNGSCSCGGSCAACGGCASYSKPSSSRQGASAADLSAETVVSIDGMMCGMCEAHINDAVRRSFTVKKVSSSHQKGETRIISAAPLDQEKLRQVIEATGYHVTGISVR